MSKISIAKNILHRLLVIHETDFELIVGLKVSHFRFVNIRSQICDAIILLLLMIPTSCIWMIHKLHENISNMFKLIRMTHSLTLGFSLKFSPKLGISTTDKTSSGTKGLSYDNIANCSNRLFAHGPNPFSLIKYRCLAAIYVATHSTTNKSNQHSPNSFAFMTKSYRSPDVDTSESTVTGCKS
jgi:hypothetical protein